MLSGSRRFFGKWSWVLLGLMMVTGQACSEEKGLVKIPAGTDMLLAVGQDGKVTVLDANGKPAKKCELCTKEKEKAFGPLCKEAALTSDICPGLTGVTVRDTNTVTIMSTQKNPCYKCTTINGVSYCVPVTCLK